MTRRSTLEYAQAIRLRYLRASKVEKGKILDEFMQVTGLHRKAAIMLLHRTKQPRIGKRRGRPKRYGSDVAGMLKAVWEASDRLCSKRLQPFLPEMVKVLRQHGEQRINAFPGSLLKSCIPIRTFADWQENKPGFMETDLVAHCGESTEGFYLSTLCTVDVASGWTECLPVWGKWQEKVRQSVHRMRQHLPFPLLGIDSDNGSEFINRCFREREIRPFVTTRLQDSQATWSRNWRRFHL